MPRHIHFIGIGGIGLSALAKIMLARGEIISGSDTSPNALTDELANAGAKIFVGHAAENIVGADLVVVTSAAQAVNPEIIAAHSQQIPIVKRRDFLRQVTAGYETIAVAGSHGKTTTTALIATCLLQGGFDPTVVVGGIVPEWNSNARVGHSQWFVIEADEYDYAFFGLTPAISVVTNVDYDHPDLFPTREAYQAAFAQFMRQTRDDGVIVTWGDDPHARELAVANAQRVVFYGLNESDGWHARQVQANHLGGSDFDIYQLNQFKGAVSLRIPGTHNVLNALATVVVAERVGVSFDVIHAALKNFTGVNRRFQVRGTFRGATVIDDYAHHPTEIRATLHAARAMYPTAHIWALFQPHTFTRTRALLDDFANSFEDADDVIITNVYAAREADDLGVSGADIVRRMNHPHTRFAATLDKAEMYLTERVKPGDVVITLGAGSVTDVATRLVENSNA